MNYVLTNRWFQCGLFAIVLGAGFFAYQSNGGNETDIDTVTDQQAVAPETVPETKQVVEVTTNKTDELEAEDVNTASQDNSNDQ